jgi:hypothetical protein
MTWAIRYYYSDYTGFPSDQSLSFAAQVPSRHPIEFCRLQSDNASTSRDIAKWSIIGYALLRLRHCHIGRRRPQMIPGLL